MCGIIGIISKSSNGLWKTHADIFVDGLIADSVRGLDSTGVFGVTVRNEAHIVKQAVDPHVLIKTPLFQKWVARANEYRVMIGHNRKATSGDITSKNAHPFREKDIILVHNGMVYNHKELNTEVEVDSHALCHSFAEKGAVETIKNVCGAFALVWYNLKEKALYMWRNSDRPLVMCERADDICIASEGDMLRWIMKRDNRGHANQQSTYSLVPQDTLFKLTFNPFVMEKQPLQEKSYSMIPAAVESAIHSVSERYFNDKEISESANDINILEEHLIEQGQKKSQALLRSNLNAKEALKLYPFESNVLFKVGFIKKILDNPLLYVINGIVYKPGHAPLNASYWPEAGFDVNRFKTWKTLGTIQAKVKIVTAKDEEINVHITNPIVPEYVATFNGFHCPKMEWKLMLGSEKCKGCGGALTTSKPELTSVKLLNAERLGTYRIHCDACVTKNIPPEKQNALLTRRRIAVQDSQPEC